MGQPPTIAKLIELLDRLLASYHDTEAVKVPYYEFDPPDFDWKTIYDQTGKRFPDLGYYPVSDPTDTGIGQLMMGDAIDDLADITKDLRGVIWYAENHGNDHADACFRDHYFHFAQHARELLVLLQLKHNT